MKFYFPKTPKFATWLYPKRIWRFSAAKKEIFLTFDDGPIPEVTPWVLDLLKEYNAKATFFCIGENILKNPEIFSRLKTEGHEVGNHTYHHLKGNKVTTEVYMEDLMKVEKVIGYRPRLFRPPYGKMTKGQAHRIHQLGYKIVMWEVLAYDWAKEISPEKCVKNVLDHMRPGSVIVFHDSIKAERNLRYTLPKVLAYIEQKGWTSSAIAIKT